MAKIEPRSTSRVRLEVNSAHQFSLQPSRKPWCSLKTGGLALTLSPCLLLSGLINPAVALQIKVSPAKPQLGDTLAVTVQYDNLEINATPVVSLGKQQYPTFLVGANQFRALLPTTPLDRPATLQIRASGGGEEKTVAVQLRARRFPTQSIWLPPGNSPPKDYKHNSGAWVILPFV